MPDATNDGQLSIIAFDPGELTGWARGIIYLDEDPTLEVRAFGYDPWKTVAMAFHRTMVEAPYDVVVYESWRLRKDKALELAGSDMQSSQCIGCIKLSTWVAQSYGNAVRLLTQGPNIKPIIDGWKGGTDYLPVDSEGKEHARDALRHLWFCACRPTTDKPNPGYGVKP